MNSRWFPFAFELMIAWVACVSTMSAQVSFEHEIKPIFEKHCYDCHGPDKQESGYRLDSSDIAMRGGDFGDAAIVPHDASKSPLYRFVSNRNDPMQMPPQDSGKENLSDKDLQTLKTWIDEGANWPDAFSGNANRSSSHWSLQPLKLQNESDKSDNKEANIDGFISKKLADNNLAPSQSADRQTLLRRLSFDLIGLPPTPEELDAFIQDESTSAYEKQVERLLASPHYGERWGRHWLDVARYTESQGFEYDRIRENAWHYRDYVIASFNQDKPYTQFMREQIAGDSIEPITKDGIVATSLLVCGPWDQAGNSQSNATQRAITREDELEDLIGVVGQSFLGLTINCARCHAHKFDPISHEDYYRIKSVFEGVKHGERDILSHEEKVARTNLRNEAQADMQRASSTLRELEKQGAQQYMSLNLDLAKQASLAPLSKWKFDLTATQTPPGEQLGGAAITKLKNGESVLNLPSEGAFFRSPPIAESIREKTLEAWVSLANLDQRGGAAIAIETEDGRVFDAIVFGENQPRQWMAGSEGFARTVPLNDLEEDSPPGTFVHVAIVYAKDNSITFYRNGKPYGKSYTPAKPLQTFQAGKARILIGMRHTGGGRPWLTGQIKQAAIYDRALNNDEVLASYHANGFSPSLEQMLSSFEPQQKRMYEEALSKVKLAERKIADLPNPPKSYTGVRVQPEKTRRLKRGDVTMPAEEVQPGALSAIEGLEADFGLSADSPEKDRRIQFANWLCDDRNPLPARVMVNRVWHLHFGQGLVSTPNDLGASGDPPSHPELLDWLAVKFIQSGWSVKALHRLIVNSNTYRQASDWNETAASIDGDNKLLWRFAPKRLEAEAIRDAMLFASGQLNPNGGGPSFRPFTTTEFNATFYTPIDRPEPEFNRRTVYRMNVNSGKDPLLDSFDCPDPSVKTPRRGVTTTPMQALELMNHSFIQRQATHLADRAMKTANHDQPQAIKTVYRLALGRLPSELELQRANEAVQQRGLFSVCWALFNSTEFLYVR